MVEIAPLSGIMKNSMYRSLFTPLFLIASFSVHLQIVFEHPWLFPSIFQDQNDLFIELEMDQKMHNSSKVQ